MNIWEQFVARCAEYGEAWVARAPGIPNGLDDPHLVQAEDVVWDVCRDMIWLGVREHDGQPLFVWMSPHDVGCALLVSAGYNMADITLDHVNNLEMDILDKYGRGLKDPIRSIFKP